MESLSVAPVKISHQQGLHCAPHIPMLRPTVPKCIQPDHNKELTTYNMYTKRPCTAAAAAACTAVVPPGYVIKENATSMSQCVSGEYRPGWLLTSDARVKNCNLCGANIRSEARDLDENPMVVNGSLVRATPECCCEYKHCLLRRQVHACMRFVATSQ